VVRQGLTVPAKLASALAPVRLGPPPSDWFQLLECTLGAPCPAFPGVEASIGLPSTGLCVFATVI
jgi:hypothetical protein